MRKQYAINKSPIRTGSRLTLWVPLVLFLHTGVQAQSSAQDQVARTFMTALFEKEYNRAWDLLDPEVQKNTTPENLAQVAKATDSLAKEFGRDLLEFMSGFRTFQTGQTIWVYTYKFRGDVTKGMMPSAVIDIAFKDKQTTLIYGFAPKFYARSQPTSTRVSTSSGEEMVLETEQKWLIEGKTINVNELALVLDSNTALLAIKVWDEEAKGITQQRAKEKAIPIVQYAIANGYVKKAELKASQAKRKLLENIGVAFIQPGTRGGFRIQITPGDYTK